MIFHYYFTISTDILFSLFWIFCMTGSVHWLHSFHQSPKYAAVPLASSQTLTDTVRGYGFEMWPGAWDIFNHVGEWHKP